MEPIAVAIAVIALLTSFITLYLEHLRRFGVACHVEGVFFTRPPENRSDSVFGVTVPMVVRNTGVRAGVIDGAYVRLVGPTPDDDVEFRLEAMIVADIAQPLVESSSSREAPGLILGVGGAIPLDKKEAKAVSVRFAFTAADSLRWEWYGRPIERFREGKYQFQVWLRWGSDKWTSFEAGKHVLRSLLFNSLPAMFMAGDMYDRAPGGPANANS